MISIMITTYNCSKYIDDCIQSVINQKKPCEWEILIGDDGSTDGTIDIIKKWELLYKDNIRVFLNTFSRIGNEKSGFRAAKNRRRLLEEARGEYLAFLDGDDRLIGTDKFIDQYNILKTNNSISGVTHNIMINNLIDKKKYPLLNKECTKGVVDRKKYWKEMYFHTNTLLFRNKCLPLMLKPELAIHLNDNLITYIVLQYGELYYINKIYAMYNITGDGVWTGEKQIFGCFRNLTLFDIEVRLNSDFYYSSVVRHLHDFYFLSKSYNTDLEDEVHNELLKKINREEFSTTYMFANKNNLTIREKSRYFFFIAYIYILRCFIGGVSRLKKLYNNKKEVN